MKSQYQRPIAQLGMRVQTDKDCVLSLLDEKMHQAQRTKLANAVSMLLKGRDPCETQ